MQELLNQHRRDCASREQMLAYIDGRLSREDASLLESHLEACQGCSRVLNEEKCISNAFEGLTVSDDSFEVPAGFAKAVASAADSEVRGLAERSSRTVALCALGVLASGAALLVSSGQDAGFESSLQAGAAGMHLLSFLFHSGYGFVVGAIGVVRSVCSGVLLGSFAAVPFLLLVLFASVAVFSSLVSRLSRVPRA